MNTCIHLPETCKIVQIINKHFKTSLIYDNLRTTNLNCFARLSKANVNKSGLCTEETVNNKRKMKLKWRKYICKNFKVPQESLKELIFIGHAVVQEDQGFRNLHVVIRVKGDIQIYRSQIAQWPCNIADSFEVLLRRPVIQARQSVLSDELQTCWAECNLFPSLPTELRCYESSLVMCLISEPVHWHWNTGQPASQKKIITFLHVLGILTHRRKNWVGNPSPLKMITKFKGFFYETHIQCILKAQL